MILGGDPVLPRHRDEAPRGRVDEEGAASLGLVTLRHRFGINHAPLPGDRP